VKSIWNVLEERTRTWNALERQSLADAVWADCVTLRFGGTGDPRALEYLYPYLNDASEGTRARALRVAGRVFEGCGPASVADLGYFTGSPRLWLRDRAVRVVGAAAAGCPDDVALEMLSPYLEHPNRFIRRQAVEALSRASLGRGSAKILEQIRRAKEDGAISLEGSLACTALAFCGCPTEETYAPFAAPGPIPPDPRPPCEWTTPISSEPLHSWDLSYWFSVLLRGASDEWYGRFWMEFVEPTLARAPEACFPAFVQREMIDALCQVGIARGVDPLMKLWDARGNRVCGHALLAGMSLCFDGAGPGTNKGPLLELLSESDVPGQRVAAVCLGRLMMGTEDDQTIEVLTALCNGPNYSVRAAALGGLGMAARSSCDAELRALCVEHLGQPEAAPTAARALGMLFLGSGRGEVFGDLTRAADGCRRGRNTRLLEACHAGVGYLYLGSGSLEPVDFLLAAVAAPRASRARGAAAKALVMVEFSESALARSVEPIRRWGRPWRWLMCSPWTEYPGA